MHSGCASLYIFIFRIITDCAHTFMLNPGVVFVFSCTFVVDFLIKDSGITGNVPANLCNHMDLIFTDCAVNRCAATVGCLETCQGPNCGG